MLLAALACIDPSTRPDPAPPTPTGLTPVACNLSTYADRDHDGFGDDQTRTIDCGVAEGRVTIGGDCDDTDASYAGPMGEARFVDVSEEAGLRDHGTNWTGVTLCLHEALGGGVAVGDVDGDGDQDLFLPRFYLESLLLLNDGAGHFTASPDWVGRADGSNGALFADLDGDRDLDLVVTAVGRSANLLYVNDGTGRFTEEGAARGLAWDPSPACGDWFGPTAGDVDLDGDLDLLIASWKEQAVDTSDHTRLYLNDGAGVFTDATVAWGLDALWDRAAFGFLLADRDRDHLPDLHLIADWGGSGLFLNRGGRFVEVQPTGVFTDENGMGGDLGDVDRDGDLDWFVASIWDDRPYCPPGWGCSGNRLYVDQGGGTFADGTDAAGVRRGQWGWSASFLDHDLDGVVDLAMTGGFAADIFYDEPGRLWRGRGDGTFTDVTCTSGWMDRGLGRAVVPFDADGDGDQDLLVQGTPEQPSLWLNSGYEGRGWIEIGLDQPGSGNRFAIGAEVTIRAVPDGPGQVRLLHANPTYVSGRPPLVHAGLGDHHGPVHEVIVRWPDGARSVYSDVGPGRVVLTR